jgi:mono/diheme cytochrome c family protein
MNSLKLILLGTALLAGRGPAHTQANKEPAPTAIEAGTTTPKQIFVKHCASCHGTDGKGNGPAAIALKPPPPDLTTLTHRHNGKYPRGYVGALLKFGRSFAAHGSEDMPVWGSRFKELDPDHDPTGQQHIDDMVAYIQSLQAK